MFELSGDHVYTYRIVLPLATSRLRAQIHRSLSQPLTPLSFQLLSVNPAENSLALVYRDKDTLKFVKHINSQTKDLQGDKTFYDFALTYFE